MALRLSSLTIILVIFTALCLNLYGQAEQEHWNPLKKENSPYSNFDITPDDTVALDVQIEVGTYQMFNEFIGSCLGATSYSDDVSLPNFIDFQTIEVTVNNLGSVRAKFELSASVTAPVGGPYAGTITYTIYRNATVCRVRTFDLTITTTLALPPIADFSGIPQSGVVPFTVQFTDQTQHGVATRLWDFGDGSTSTLRNPQHTYTIPDSYNVSLDVSGPAGTDLVSKQNYIKAYDCGNGNIYWTGTGDGVSWSDPANWCSGTIPGTNDHVYIIFDEFVTAGGTYTINLDSDAAVNSLTLGGDTGQQTLTIAGATLTITNALMVKANGELELSGGTINGTGDIFVKGTLKWIGGTIGGFGNFTVDGLLSIETGGTAILVDRLLTINHTGWISHSVGTFISETDIIVNGLFSWLSGSTLSGTGFLIINDSLRIEGGGGKTLDAKTLINNGPTIWTGGSIYLNNGSVFTNDTSGIFDIQTSSLNYRIQSADSGSFDNWGMLIERSATDIWVPFSNSGTVVVDSSSRLNLARDGSYSGTFIVNEGGDLTFGGSSITTHNFFPSAVITANGTVTFGIGIFVNNSDLEIEGLLRWTGGTIRGTGFLVINDSLKIEGSGGKTLDDKTLLNRGSTVWTGGSIYLNNGSVFTNDTSGIFDIQTSSLNYRIQSADSGSFDNWGMLIERSTTDIWVPFSNSGTVVVDSSSYLNLTDDFINQASGDIRGYGTLNLSSANFINQGSVSPGTSPGILTFTGNYETSNAILNIELDNSAIPGSGHDQLLVSGSSTLGGTLNLDVTNGYIPNPGEQFTVLHSNNGHSGTFASINAPLWLTYQIQYTNNDVIINILTVNAPQLISPLNEAVNVTTTPELMWHSIASADSYHAQVSTELTFLAPVVDETGITDTSFTTPMLNNNTTYYWRVRAQNSIGPTPPWSEIWHFSTVALFQVTATVVCPGSSSQGCPVTVKNQIDMSAAQPPDSLLGSFTGTLAWDPALLHYTGNSGLLSGFTGNVTADTIAGLISFSGTHPSGVGGIFDILNADFEATGPIGATPQQNLDFSAMASAGTLTNLLPTLTINNCTLTISESDLWGDIDNDNAANSTDGLIILSYDAGLPLPPNFLERINAGFGDVNSDNATNSTDALIILSYDAGFPVPYPVGQIFCTPSSTIMAGRPD